MPKQTYFNLSEEKRNKIYETLVREFEENAVKDVTVKKIVEELNIPRGSFYQYFESVYESYFYVLEQEIVEIHESFLKLVRTNDGDIIKALDMFGQVAAKEIFDDKKYRLYRNRYLYLDADLERQWMAYQMKNTKYGNDMRLIAEREKISFISAVMHSLIRRLFTENWTIENFIEHYNIHLNWIKGGIIK